MSSSNLIYFPLLLSMSSMASSTTIPNVDDPATPLVAINLTNILKLTTTNYLSWKLQIEATPLDIASLSL